MITDKRKNVKQQTTILLLLIAHLAFSLNLNLINCGKATQQKQHLILHCSIHSLCDVICALTCCQLMPTKLVLSKVGKMFCLVRESLRDFFPYCVAHL